MLYACSHHPIHSQRAALAARRHHFPAAAAPTPALGQQHAIDASRRSNSVDASMAEVPPPKREADNNEEPQGTKKQKTGSGLKRADGTPWEPITGTLVPIVGGKEGLKQVRDAAWP